MTANDIKVISFDADGTLFDFNRVMHLALEEVLTEVRRQFQEAASKLTIETLIAHRNEAAHELRGVVATMEDIRLAGFKRTLAHIGVADNRLAVELTNLFLDCRFAKIETYGDVLPALQSLREHYILGVLSNGNSYPERCGLEGWFSFGVYAHDYGLEKPDKRIFDIMVSRSGHPPSQILHVGDSLRNDVLGAKQAGIRTVWINRDDKQMTGKAHPDFEISSLTELASICKLL